MNEVERIVKKIDGEEYVSTPHLVGKMLDVKCKDCRAIGYWFEEKDCYICECGSIREK